MLRNLIMLLSLLSASCITAQVSLERQLVGSVGQSVTTPGLQLSFSGGGAATTTLSGRGYTLTQGFQQAEAEELTPVVLAPELLSALLAYPNPASGSFRLRISGNGNQSVVVVLIGGDGRELRRKVGTVTAGGSTELLFSLVDLPPGLYTACVRTEAGRLAGTVHVLVE